MRIPGLGRLKRAARRTANRWTPGALILLYHRVTRLETDPQWLTVPPATFDEQLDMLRRNWPVMPLTKLVAALRENALPKRSVVVTFDDGYADNLHEAKPLLEKHALPATVFVSSGFVGRREEFFWDELDRLLLHSPTLPERLEWPGLAGWSFGSSRCENRPVWNVLHADSPDARHEAYRMLCPIFAHADPETRRRWLDGLRAWAGTTPDGRESHRTVTPDELQRLAAGNLIEIGAHTVHHPRLASLPLDAQRREMRDGKLALESIIDRPVTTFSYPFGGPGDYTADTARLAGENGFTAACANFGGSVRRGADPFQLNRVLVRDWPADELDRRIREWFRD
jgi:peptidoglycan/xylan/chitin deacetylase (PgdA/CDA1 family)